MPLITAQDIVSFALRAVGILGTGQTALAQDNADAFSALQGMIGQWNRKRWMIWHLIDVPLASTGAQSYSVGIGGDFDIPRPDRLEAAFLRQIIGGENYAVDYPLRLLESREDYNRIALKSLTSWPQAIFYDSAYPLGYVYPYPVPLGSPSAVVTPPVVVPASGDFSADFSSDFSLYVPGQNVVGDFSADFSSDFALYVAPAAANANVAIYELHITVKDTLMQFATYTAPVNLPPEYQEALWSNLAWRLSSIYPGAIFKDETKALAIASMATIRGANTQIGKLRMPDGLGRGSLYNIFSDSVY